MRRLLLAGLLTMFTVPMFAFAQLQPNETGLSDTGETAYGGQAPQLGEFIGSNIIAPLFGIIGVIFLVLVIAAGFLWMTAAGNDTQIARAKNILISTIIGTVLIIGAYAITFFIFTSLVPTQQALGHMIAVWG